MDTYRQPRLLLSSIEIVIQPILDFDYTRAIIRERANNYISAKIAVTLKGNASR